LEDSVRKLKPRYPRYQSSLLQAALMLDMDILERRVEDMDWDGRRILEAKSHRLVSTVVVACFLQDILVGTQFLVFSFQ
jgi:hypothetical protein